MKEMIDFCNRNKFGNLATCDNEKPDTRPMELVYYCEKGFYFYTSATDDLAKQLKDNANICFCATDSSYNYVKLNGSVQISSDNEDKLQILERSVFASKAFNTSNLDTMLVFFLPSGTFMMHTHGKDEKPTGIF